MSRNDKHKGYCDAWLNFKVPIMRASEKNATDCLNVNLSVYAYICAIVVLRNGLNALPNISPRPTRAIILLWANHNSLFFRYRICLMHFCDIIFRGFAITFSITFFTNYTDNHSTEELKGKSVNISHFDWTCEENREPTITSNNSTWTLMINGAKKENSTSTHIVYVDIYIWRR